MEEKKSDIICLITVGRDGSEWVALILYNTGKTMEFRNDVFEEVMCAMAREVEGVE
jgi:hypothetical protein